MILLYKVILLGIKILDLVILTVIVVQLAIKFIETTFHKI